MPGPRNGVRKDGGEIRRNIVAVRLTEREKLAVNAAARNAGLNREAYIRALLQGDARVRETAAALHEIVGTLDAIYMWYTLMSADGPYAGSLYVPPGIAAQTAPEDCMACAALSRPGQNRPIEA